ncbi:MAG: DUF883 family protein [Balneolaceae bacterium]|nr:DUF883 family protein [Balneolaceae bacterium]MCH8547812.1 hypothetical protein [Balneolaceae bacterium]
MADIKDAEKELKEAIKKEKKALNDAYDDMVGRLKKEQKRLSNEFQKEVEQARTYVKKNPEASLGIALASGLVVGLALSKLFRR